MAKKDPLEAEKITAAEKEALDAGKREAAKSRKPEKPRPPQAPVAPAEKPTEPAPAPGPEPAAESKPEAKKPEPAAKKPVEPDKEPEAREVQAEPEPVREPVRLRIKAHGVGNFDQRIEDAGAKIFGAVKESPDYTGEIEIEIDGEKILAVMLAELERQVDDQLSAHGSARHVSGLVPSPTSEWVVQKDQAISWYGNTTVMQKGSVVSIQNYGVDGMRKLVEQGVKLAAKR